MAVDTHGFNYLMLSDVHLGSDLVQHAAPWTAPRLSQAREVDEQLVSMLAHYQHAADPQRPWKLVLAGDFIDLVGMSVAPTAADSTAPTAEELRHGLGNASAQSAAKMCMVVERHRRVFAALGAFVRAGHHLIMVRGNHDVELYWLAAQAVFRQALVELQPQAPSPSEQAAMMDRVRFCDWFYYEPGILYVEHGHQYDETCAHRYQLAPLCPRDGSRLSYSFSDILLRYIVRPTRGLSSDGHENCNVLHYVRLGASLGMWECARLAGRFGRALAGMVRAWRNQTPLALSHIERLHEERLHALAGQLGVSRGRLRALQDLSVTPVTAGLQHIARSVFFDRLAALGALGAMLLVLWRAQFLPLGGLASLGVAAALPLALRLHNARVMDPDELLKERAAELARILPARFVVMGHTHLPRFERAGDARYVNLGFWAGDDSEAPVAAAPPCSHLVLRHDGARHQPALLAWNSRTGVRFLDVDRDADGAGNGAGGQFPAKPSLPVRPSVGRPIGAMG